jgi:hypothetical protein
VNSTPTEAETYASTSTRITGGIAIVIGLACLVDIAVEWRTRTGLITAALIGVAMVLAYVGLIRPSVTLSPERLAVRNHLRDHTVPWSLVKGADITDILRVELEGRRLRCPAVQVVMRDMRRQRAGRVKADKDTSLSRAEFVADRVDYHRDYYGKSSIGEPTSRWALPELIVIAALLLIALITWIAG